MRWTVASLPRWLCFWWVVAARGAHAAVVRLEVQVSAERTAELVVDDSGGGANASTSTASDAVDAFQRAHGLQSGMGCHDAA